MTDPLWINADAGSPVYDAVELRRDFGALLLPGVADRLGARAGVRPGGLDAVTLSGQTIIVRDSNMVVYPGTSATDAAYLVHFLEHTHTLDPADGSNDRTDIVVARVYDDDHDSSGRREAVTEYIAGTPGGGQPSTPAGALLLATILVPAGGSPSPTLAYVAPFTVASGGVLPVRSATDRPAAGLYEGLTVYRQDTDAIEVWDGSGWQLLAAVTQNPVRGANTATFTPLTNTTYAATSTPAGLTFVAPPSGRGLLICSARLILDVTANVARLALGSPWLGTGGTINGGSAVDIEGLTPPNDQLAFIISRNHVSVQVDNVDTISSDTYLVDGLTPGNTYNAALRYRTTNASNMFYTVERQRVRWVPFK